MKLDNDLLKNMIAETLGAVVEEMEGSAPDIDPIFAKLQEAHNIIAEVETLVSARMGALDRSRQAQDSLMMQMNQRGMNEAVDPVRAGTEGGRVDKELMKTMANLSKQINELIAKLGASSQETTSTMSSGGTMEESFQLTKGRLRQIIAEELASAKKQGIL